MNSEVTNDAINKEQWVLLFREIGLDHKTMAKWHRVFESRYPNGHQSFLEWLRLPQDEIAQIRE